MREREEQEQQSEGDDVVVKEQGSGRDSTDLSTRPTKGDGQLKGNDAEEIEATTWEGMPTVGGKDWGMDVWDEENFFEGYVC